MSWTASAVIKMPNKVSKRAVITVSIIMLTAALMNLMMFFYIEYINAYRTAKTYVEAQHSIFQRDLARGVMTDDIFTVFKIIDTQTKALPYIDNIAVYDVNNSYVADAKVLRGNIVSDLRNVGIEKRLVFEYDKVGTVVYFISRMVILEQIIMNVSSLVMLNIVIVLIGIFASGYVSFRITKPVRELSQHLQEINAPEHKTLEFIKKNKFRTGFRPKSENTKKIYAAASTINFRTVRRRSRG